MSSKRLEDFYFPQARTILSYHMEELFAPQNDEPLAKNILFPTDTIPNSQARGSLVQMDSKA